MLRPGTMFSFVIDRDLRKSSDHFSNHLEIFLFSTCALRKWMDIGRERLQIVDLASSHAFKRCLSRHHQVRVKNRESAGEQENYNHA